MKTKTMIAILFVFALLGISAMGAYGAYHNSGRIIVLAILIDVFCLPALLLLNAEVE